MFLISVCILLAKLAILFDTCNDWEASTTYPEPAVVAVILSTELEDTTTSSTAPTPGPFVVGETV